MLKQKTYRHLKISYGLGMFLSIAVFVGIVFGVQVEQEPIWRPNQEIVSDVNLSEKPNIQYFNFQVLNQSSGFFQTQFDRNIKQAFERCFSQLLVEKIKCSKQSVFHLDFSNRFYKLKIPQKISDPLVTLS